MCVLARLTTITRGTRTTTAAVAAATAATITTTCTETKPSEVHHPNNQLTFLLFRKAIKMA